MSELRFKAITKAEIKERENEEGTYVQCELDDGSTLYFMAFRNYAFQFCGTPEGSGDFGSSDVIHYELLRLISDQAGEGGWSDALKWTPAKILHTMADSAMLKAHVYPYDFEIKWVFSEYIDSVAEENDFERLYV